MTSTDEKFVKFPIYWAVAVAKATRSPTTLVLVHMLLCAWRASGLSFPLSNAWLEQHGVSRDVKRRVLRDLEEAGIITVERAGSKSPVVTLVTL